MWWDLPVSSPLPSLPRARELFYALGAVASGALLVRAVL
jgi:hypothetical protein